MRKGTVDIRVLPPISVADWTRPTMGRRVEAVREQFVQTLAEWPA